MVTISARRYVELQINVQVLYPIDYIPVRCMNLIWSALNARIGRLVAIWEIVCDSHPQSQEGVACSFHLSIMWQHLPRPVCKRFGVAQIFLGRSKPVCLVVGLVIMFRPSGFSSIHSLCHLIITSIFSGINFSAVIQGGPRDWSRSLPPIALRSACIGRFVLLAILVRYRMRACSLRVFGWAISLSTGSRFHSYVFNSFRWTSMIVFRLLSANPSPRGDDQNTKVSRIQFAVARRR